MGYTSNFTVPQFEQLEKLLPQRKTRGYTVSRHDLVTVVVYQLKKGCQWRDLPADFPNWQTVYSQFRRWQRDGTWQKVLAGARQSKKTQFRAC